MSVRKTKGRGNGGIQARLTGKLTPKQMQFVKEYMIDLNGAAAARRAGYSEKTAREQAARMLSNVRIQEAIERAFRERQARTEINADRVLQELAIIGFSDIKDYVDIDPDTGAIRAKDFESMRPGASRAIESVTEDRTIHEDASGKGVIMNDKRRIKLHSKVNALELLGRHLNLFKDVVPLTGTAFVIVDGEKPKGN